MVVEVLAALGDAAAEADLNVREPVVHARVVEAVRVATAKEVRERASQARLDCEHACEARASLARE